MNCDWEYTDKPAKNPGWRYVRCTRRGCGITGGPTPHSLDNIQSSGCRGWPRWHELGHIVEFILAVLGIDQRRFNDLRRLCGFVQPCKCPQRIAVLNESGGWLRDRLDVLAVLWRRLTSCFSARE